MVFDPLLRPLVESRAAESAAQVYAIGFHLCPDFFGERRGAAITELGENVAVDSASFGGFITMPDDGKKHVSVRFNDTSMASIVIAWNSGELPLFGWNIVLWKNIGQLGISRGDSVAIGTAPLWPVGNGRNGCGKKKAGNQCGFHGLSVDGDRHCSLSRTAIIGVMMSCRKMATSGVFLGNFTCEIESESCLYHRRSRWHVLWELHPRQLAAYWFGRTRLGHFAASALHTH